MCVIKEGDKTSYWISETSVSFNYLRIGREGSSITLAYSRETHEKKCEELYNFYTLGMHKCAQEWRLPEEWDWGAAHHLWNACVSFAIGSPAWALWHLKGIQQQTWAWIHYSSIWFKSFLSLTLTPCAMT